MKLGAEADITISNDKKYIIKKRIKKKYRIPEMDEKIRKSRTKREAKLLQLCFSKQIPVPKVSIEDKYTLIIEYISGKTLKEFLDTCQNENKIKSILKKCGFFIAKIHKNNIVHNDFTSTNIIVKQEKNKQMPYFIDFGFGQITPRFELKAMDIHMFKKSFNASFPQLKKYLHLFCDEYFNNLDDCEAKQIRKRLLKIEQRGRYKKSSKFETKYSKFSSFFIVPFL